MEHQGYEEDLLRRWFPQDAEGPAKHLTETDICDIAEVLTRSSKDAWSRVPRIYSVLRKIGQLDAIDAFIDDGFTDVFFPFSGATLPETLRDHSARLNFLELQHLVYDTEALDLERHARHGHFSDPKDVPLKKVGELGKGGFGYVDRVVSTISHKEYARKLISRGRTFRKDKQVLRAFTKELSNLKGLSHRHLVKLAGSYSDKKFVAIIMLPVADMNLQTFLENTNLDDTSRSFLRPFFGCLTSALSYLHDNRIRHKDIKPSNVLIKYDQVYLTDFGTSLDWSGCDNSTTVTAPPTTPRYCAPEVMAFVERNTSSDIWSLGCVFLEMWTVLKRYTLDELKAHMSANGSHVKEYHHNLDAIASWIQMLKNTTGPSCDLAPSKWVQNMLQHKPRSRWNCHVLANHIQEASIDPSSEYAFKGLCCLEPDDDTTDETESSDGQSEAESFTPSLPIAKRRDPGHIVGPAASERPQPKDTVGNEATSSASVFSRAQHDAPIPRIMVNDSSVPPGAFVEDESDSLARELYDPSTPTRVMDDLQGVNSEHDGIVHSATDSDFSGSNDETLQEEVTYKASLQASSDSSLPHPPPVWKDLPRAPSPLANSSTTSCDRDEILKRFSIPCGICFSKLKVADSAVQLPCHHWIHNSCRGQGYRRMFTGCPRCREANIKPASQANRYFCELNDWARNRNDLQDSLRSSKAKRQSEAEKTIDAWAPTKPSDPGFSLEDHRSYEALKYQMQAKRRAEASKTKPKTERQRVHRGSREGYPSSEERPRKAKAKKRSGASTIPKFFENIGLLPRSASAEPQANAVPATGRPATAEPRTNVIPARSRPTQRSSANPVYRTVEREPLSPRPKEPARSDRKQKEMTESGDDSDDSLDVQHRRYQRTTGTYVDCLRAQKVLSTDLSLQTNDKPSRSRQKERASSRPQAQKDVGSTPRSSGRDYEYDPSDVQYTRGFGWDPRARDNIGETDSERRVREMRDIPEVIEWADDGDGTRGIPELARAARERRVREIRGIPEVIEWADGGDGARGIPEDARSAREGSVGDMRGIPEVIEWASDGDGAQGIPEDARSARERDRANASPSRPHFGRTATYVY